MTTEERYELALRILANNLRPPGGYDFRPMASDLQHSLAEFAEDVLNGLTPADAAARQHAPEAPR